MFVLRNGRRSLPMMYRKLRRFPGTHVISREYRIWHYTNREALADIRKSEHLIPGSGHKGVGIYLTMMHPDAGFSIEEIKIAVRHPRLPDSAVSHIVEIDTDDLDARGIKYKAFGNTVFIPTDKPLHLKGMAKYQTNPLAEE